MIIITGEAYSGAPELIDAICNDETSPFYRPEIFTTLNLPKEELKKFNHLYTPQKSFERLDQLGWFGFTWEDNGLMYGIPKGDLDNDLNAIVLLEPDEIERFVAEGNPCFIVYLRTPWLVRAKRFLKMFESSDSLANKPELMTYMAYCFLQEDEVFANFEEKASLVIDNWKRDSIDDNSEELKLYFYEGLHKSKEE